MRGLLIILVTAVAPSLVGCTNMHDLLTRAQVSDANTLGATRTLAAHVPGSGAPWPTADWWKQFGDLQLDALVTEGLAQSPNLKIAQARIMKAGALANL